MNTNDPTSSGSNSNDVGRSIKNYNIWRIVIKRNVKYGKVFEATVERQKKISADTPAPSGQSKKNLWQSLTKEQEYKQTTKDEFQSLLLKIVYCLIDDKDLYSYSWYTVDRELDSLLQAKTLMDIEDFIQRLLDMGNVSKKRLQAIINYYTRSMYLPYYSIPSNVELPKDKEKRKRLARNKTIVLKDDFIDPIVKYIEDEIKYRNFYHNLSLIRAAVVFNIIKGTGLRITNAYQITLKDLELVYEKGEHKVMGLMTKHGKVNFCFVKCVDKKALKMAIDLYKTIPEDSLNKLSSKSSTRFKDMKLLVNEVFKETQDANFKSTMIRNYVADTMLNRGITLNKTSKMMNHKSIGATRHYINKFHPGPTLVEEDNDNSSGSDNGIINTNSL